MKRVCVIAALLCCVSSSAAFERGCGTRGGPGYRSAEGKCVGWKNLRSVCGDPPSTRCTAEGHAAAAAAAAAAGAAVTAVGAGTSAAAAAEDDTKRPKDVPRGFTSFNVRTVATDAVGCISQIDLAKVRACSAVGRVSLADSGSPRSCEQDRAAAITEGRCVQLTRGMEVAIEAGDGGFGAVRVRVPSRQAPVWIERALVLGR